MVKFKVMKFVELSVPINENIPVYPGDPKTKIQPAGILDKDGYEDHYVSLGTHVGTHIDAPRHMVEDGKSIDQFPLDKFIGNGVLINTGKNIDFSKVKETNLKENDIVLFNTSMSKVYHQSKYYDDRPALTEEIGKYLVSKRVKMVGVDMCSVDLKPFNIHRILLREEILIIENLTNLSALESKNFKVYALPLRLQIDGAPARVVAAVE